MDEGHISDRYEQYVTDLEKENERLNRVVKILDLEVAACHKRIKRLNDMLAVEAPKESTQRCDVTL